jgi:GrpB-like predicted nucleotidyltransferase (UPF0157 family)
LNGPIRIRPEAEIRAAAEGAFDAHRARIAELLPEADIEHVGSTSIPGALTKGDVDLLVRVEEGAFATASATLRELYAVHQPENWTPTYASFSDPEAADPPVGVQLAVKGSPDDALFGPFREAMMSDPALLAEYNALKLRLDGADYERYTKVKGEFVERVLGRSGRRPA